MAALAISAATLLGIATPAHAQRKVTLTYADYHPTSFIAVQVMHDWAKYLAEKTGGAVEFKFHHGGSLISAVDMMPGIREGRADIGLINTLYQPGEWPTATLDGLPFVTRSAEAQSLAYMELYRTNAVFRQQWSKNNLHLIGRGLEGTHIGVSRTPVKSLMYVEGKTMRVCSWTGKALANLRVNPVSISQPEVFEGLQRGVLNMTTCISLGSALDFGYMKIAPHVFDSGTGIYSMNDLVINLDTWNKLPANVREAIDTSAAEFFMKRQIAMLDAKTVLACNAFKQAGGTFTIFPDAEYKDFESRARAVVYKEWLDGAKAKGTDGQATLDAYIPLVRKYEAQDLNVHGVRRCLQ